MANITEESQNQIVTKKLGKKHSKELKEKLLKYFYQEASFNPKENEISLCNNEILNNPEFIKILKEYKVFINLSLFD